MTDIQRTLIIALGGFVAEPAKRDQHPLDWSLMKLRAKQYDSALARRIAEQIPAWQSHPSWALSRWLKTAPEAKVIKVRAMLREIGQDV